MKKILYITFFFLMLVLVLFFSYALVNNNTNDATIENKDAVSIVTSNELNQIKYVNFLKTFSYKKNVQIVKSIYNDSEQKYYSTKKININNSIFKFGNTFKNFDISEIKNAGYDGKYNISGDANIFCQEFKKEGFGKCEIFKIGESSNLLLIISILIVLPLLFILYIIFNFIVLSAQKKIALQHIEGMATRKTVYLFYKEIYKPFLLDC